MSITENNDGETIQGPILSRQLCVLIVDDQPLVRKAVRLMLEKMGGFKAMEASDGDDAKKVLLNQQMDLILCDINMSPGCGIEFLYDLRSGKLGAAPQTPLIFLSCNSSPAMIQEAIDLGVNGYLTKPVLAEKLHKTILSVLTAPLPA